MEICKYKEELNILNRQKIKGLISDAMDLKSNLNTLMNERRNSGLLPGRRKSGNDFSDYVDRIKEGIAASGTPEVSKGNPKQSAENSAPLDPKLNKKKGNKTPEFRSGPSKTFEEEKNGDKSNIES